MTDTNYRTALVTGASSGIGLATARALAEQGLAVTVTARRGDRIRALAEEIGGEAVVCDLRDRKAIARSLAGREVDVLVNNAGLGRGFGRFCEATEEDIETTIGVNVLGVLHVLRTVLPGMVERRRGHVIHIGSIAGLYPVAPVIYGASKGAVHLLHQDLRMDLAGAGVRVTEICPGRVRTGFFDVAFDDEETRRKFMVDMTMLEAEDIAAAIRFAVSQPGRVNVSTIEVTPTDQAPGGMRVAATKGNRT